MQSIRETVDALEPLCGTGKWPYPSYAEMLLRN
jgi:glutamine synthetase type III